MHEEEVIMLLGQSTLWQLKMCLLLEATSEVMKPYMGARARISRYVRGGKENRASFR